MCLGVSLSVSAQKDYDRPINKWSVDEARKIVSESAWAKTYQSTRTSSAADAVTAGRELGQSVNSGGSNPRSVARYLGPPPVVIALHSSEVYRKAAVRLQQAAAGYEKMSADDQAKFDAGRKTFLDCAICKDYYVVTLSKFAEKNSTTVDEGIFQGMTLEHLKGNVKLVNDKGEVREIIQFIPPKASADSALFFFKRTNDKGEHLITPDSKELRLVFTNTFLDSNNRYAYLLPRSFDFKVSKMMVGEKLMF